MPIRRKYQMQIGNAVVESPISRRLRWRDWPPRVSLSYHIEFICLGNACSNTQSRLVINGFGEMFTRCSILQNGLPKIPTSAVILDNSSQLLDQLTELPIIFPCIICYKAFFWIQYRRATKNYHFQVLFDALVSNNSSNNLHLSTETIWYELASREGIVLI